MLGLDQVDPARGATEAAPVTIAHGFREDGTAVADTRLMFPPLAAGAHGSPRALCRFLYHLARAYRMPAGTKSGPIPHETARTMLDGAVELGAFDFMHSRMGLGVFVTLVGPNRFMLHQRPTTGFAACFSCALTGPTRGAGLCCCRTETTTPCL